jgi:hypothetical protein
MQTRYRSVCGMWHLLARLLAHCVPVMPCRLKLSLPIQANAAARKEAFWRWRSVRASEGRGPTEPAARDRAGGPAGAAAAGLLPAAMKQESCGDVSRSAAAAGVQDVGAALSTTTQALLWWLRRHARGAVPQSDAVVWLDEIMLCAYQIRQQMGTTSAGVL